MILVLLATTTSTTTTSAATATNNIPTTASTATENTAITLNTTIDSTTTVEYRTETLKSGVWQSNCLLNTSYPNSSPWFNDPSPQLFSYAEHDSTDIVVHLETFIIKSQIKASTLK